MSTTLHRLMRHHARILVVLDTMWGSGGNADRWFIINPHNRSGQRLYKLTGLRIGQVWVTNACPEQTTHARAHGTPDACWLYDNLKAASLALPQVPVLVCGKVAQSTMEEMVEDIGLPKLGPIISMPHPAARSWTKRGISAMQRRIARTLSA